MQYEIVTLKNNNLVVIVSTLGAELKSIRTADGTEHLHQPDKFWQDQAPILFPICGTPVNGTIRVDGKEYAMDSHGFAKTCIFHILEQTEDSVTFELSSSLETKRIYPFDFKLELTYSLQDNVLNIRHKVVNESNRTMFFSIGYHEGFLCKNGLQDYEIHFEKNESTSPFVFETKKTPEAFLKIENGHSVLSMSDELFENAITVVYENLDSSYVTLKEKNSEKDIRISFPGFDRLLIWSMPGSTFVCIEPWCGMAEYESPKDISCKPGIHSIHPNNIFEGEHKISFSI